MIFADGAMDSSDCVMNVDNNDMYLNPFDERGVTVVVDESKGRCLSSISSFKVGDSLYTEQAFVWADDFEDIEIEEEGNIELLRAAFCNKSSKSKSSSSNKSNKRHQSNLLSQYGKYCSILADFDHVQSYDTAKCFYQLLALAYIRKLDLLSSLLSSSTASSSVFTENNIQLLDLLTCSNLSECVDDIRAFREANPTIIPSCITSEEAGRLLSILNTNQVELEQLGGSGLFVGTAITEHNCNPNCSFSTNGNQLCMTVIRDIEPNDRISIDYTNCYYRPTSERQAKLKDTYGFHCVCETCTNIDITRPFLCKYCKLSNSNNSDQVGIFYPIGTGAAVWSSCTKCNSNQDNQYIQECIDKEEHYSQCEVSCIKDVALILSEKYIHHSHYLVFSSYDEISMNAVNKARKSSGVASKNAYKIALVAMEKAYELLDKVLPPVHHERVVYLDKLAQISVGNNDKERAVYYYTQAYYKNCKCTGIESQSSIDLLKLVKNTPNSLDELFNHYSHML